MCDVSIATNCDIPQCGAFDLDHRFGIYSTCILVHLSVYILLVFACEEVRFFSMICMVCIVVMKKLGNNRVSSTPYM